MAEPSSPPTSPQYIPYQAYKPKRQSRNFSNSPSSRPSSIIISPMASPLPRAFLDDDRDSITPFSLAGTSGTSSSVAPRGFMPKSPSPTIRIELAPDNPVESASSVKAPSTVPQQDQLQHEPGVPIASHERIVQSNGTTSPAHASVSLPPVSSPQSGGTTNVPLPKVKKPTTFRRLAPRPASTVSSLSTLPSSHSRSVSTTSLPTNPRSRGAHTSMESMESRLAFNDRPRTTSLLGPSVGSPIKPLPVLRAESFRLDEPLIKSPRTPPVVTQVISPPPPTTNGSSSSCVTSHTPSANGAKYRSAPYPKGFQPKGTIRQRTDEFLAARRLKRDGEGEEGRLMRIEQAKLERRLEKLIILHFPPADSLASEKLSPTLRKKKEPNSTVRRASSFFDLEKMKGLKLNDPGELWRGVVDSGGKEDTRASEQRITPWEEDNAVSKCPLCLASFHSLTNRKHHCRLCGKIICSLPAKSPQRPLMCSLLFFVDSKTKHIEEVGEGVDYGVKRRNRPEGEDKFLRAVRICRNCRPIILRQQYSQQAEEAPIFFKLYDVFINLEKEIEDSLPQFQELILSLSHNDQPTKEASAARKRLLDAFAQYDRLSKQIRGLPCPNGPGSSQDRIQTSILTRASLFLQKNMFPLQSLPRPPASNGLQQPKKCDDALGLDLDSELARTLQPLLEQEALLESFVDEARAQRKFEDVKTLKRNQDEIRGEIERLLDAADIGCHPTPPTLEAR